jgi:hypothetical protein
MGDAVKHWHLKVTLENGTIDRWCGDSLAQVRKTLEQYLEVASMEAKPLKRPRSTGWCHNPMPRND